MTEEERQRQMDFILNQQARFAVDIQKLQEGQQKLQESQAEATQLITGLAAVMQASFNELRGSISALVDSQVRTEENIRNLTAVVDRNFSEGRNGESQ